jgi:poly(3-hydroxybutyrate) depolymerase
MPTRTTRWTAVWGRTRSPAFLTSLASRWALRKANGCSTATDTSREGAVSTTVWRGCRPGGETEQRIIAGASHAWPGATRAGAGIVGPPSQALDATEEVWRFFETDARGR